MNPPIPSGPHFLSPQALPPHLLSPQATHLHLLSPQALPPHLLSLQALPSHLLSPQALPPHLLSPQALPPHLLSPQALPPHLLSSAHKSMRKDGELDSVQVCSQLHHAPTANLSTPLPGGTYTTPPTATHTCILTSPYDVILASQSCSTTMVLSGRRVKKDHLTSHEAPPPQTDQFLSMIMQGPCTQCPKVM